jgi:hypothetical protein
VLREKESLTAKSREHLRLRTTHFRNAFVSLHVSANVFAAGSIVGAFLYVIDVEAGPELLRESVRSQEVILDHLEQTLNQSGS